MKKRLEPSDLAQLTDKQKDRLRELWDVQIGNFVTIDECDENIVVGVHECDSMSLIDIDNGQQNDIDKHYVSPLLNIGQMVEILKERRIIIWQGWGNHLSLWNVEKLILNSDKAFELIGKGDELCDALWQAVKEIL